MRLALFQPDIPQNTGALMRLGACFATPLDIIEPCGFPIDDKRLKRTAMDYGGICEIARHASWQAFLADLRAHPERRLIVLSTSGAVPHAACEYRADDVLLVGRESFGVPPEVHDSADIRVRIPIAEGVRSLNVVVAAAVVIAEAQRQLGLLI
ncbi:MAG: tRNA methyltransferase [Rhodobacteraceae bacterium]|nr:tRNA methyltransferase [Paracoccaceae bacterium]